jgi:histidyl-tRNA synthetase
MAFDLLKKLGLENSNRLLINTLGDAESRATYRTQLVDYLTKYKNELSADSQIRLEKNPLRILDSKEAQDKKITQDCPKMQNSLNANSLHFFDQVQKGLTQLGIAYTVDPFLVRGIDYYTHTVFEFVTDRLGAQGTLLAGGRYDGLIETMGGPATPGVGWAAGLERLAELLPSELITQSVLDVAVIPADDASELWALEVANAVRKQNQVCEILWGGNVGKKMKKASNMKARFAFILGSTESSSKTVTFKNLSTGVQEAKSLSDTLRAISTI